MVRRDQFVDRYSALNNRKLLELELADLEKYVDSELLKDENIVVMINQDGVAGTDGEVISTTILNQSVHKDPSIRDNGSGRSGGLDNVEYAIWSEDITTTSSVGATETPWYDKTLNVDTTGVIEVYLPIGTNKNLATMLVDKYLGPADFTNLTNRELSTYGFWRKIPTLGSAAGESTVTDDTDAVQLIYVEATNQYKIVFQLNP